MPMPVSVTATLSRSSSSREMATTIWPPSGVNFTAFEIRFSTTCFRPR
jgi:hypothetical protein